jgi:hypothetical protein
LPSGRKSAWAWRGALVRPRRTANSKGIAMVNVPDSKGSHDSNFPVHVRNYLSFMTILKWTMILVAIIAAVVLYVISN